MHYLMNKFAPADGESDDALFDLIYGPLQSEHEGGEANRSMSNRIVYNALMVNC